MNIEQYKAMEKKLDSISKKELEKKLEQALDIVAESDSLKDNKVEK